MAWTNIPKPTGVNYTNLNPIGKEQYDQATLTYDDSSTYYDGVNPNQWSSVQRIPNAWDVSKASFYQGVNISAQTPSVEWIFFREDGLMLYVGDGDSGDKIYQYSLSTAWDISTLSYIRTLTISITGYPDSGFFSPDGENMYIINSTGSDAVRQYALSTPWNISTATYLQQVLIPQDAAPTGLSFSSDGLQMYISGNAGNRINQYSLTTAWDITTATFVQFFSVASQTTTPDGIYFRADGLKFYLVNSQSSSKVWEYNLSTAWNISTASFNQSFTISASDLDVFSIFFSSNGIQMYISSLNSYDLMEYLLAPLYTKIAKPT